MKQRTSYIICHRLQLKVLNLFYYLLDVAKPFIGENNTANEQTHI